VPRRWNTKIAVRTPTTLTSVICTAVPPSDLTAAKVYWC
jgi:hypothetical protein